MARLSAVVLALALGASLHTAHAQLTIDLGGNSGNNAGGSSGGAVPSDSALPSEASSSVATTPLATSGSVSTVSQAEPTFSPAVAQGTLTYVPPPKPSSTTTIDVSSLPASVAAFNATVSSNFTLPSATATATWAALPSNMVSNPYQMVLADTSGLPEYEWTLAAPSVPIKNKEAVCAQQIDFCAKAGCVEPDAKLTNFCETEHMGTACSCSKGASRLQQYHWPVMLADCRGRNTACHDACTKPNQGTAGTNDCKNACDRNFGNNCGTPGQYAANYAVSKKGQKPDYAVIQGGDAGNSATGMLAGRSTAVAVAAVALAALLA